MRGSHVIHALPLEPQLPLGVSQALEKLLADRAPIGRTRRDACWSGVNVAPRSDSVDAAWAVVDPMLGDLTPVYPYEPAPRVQLRRITSSRSRGLMRSGARQGAPAAMSGGPRRAAPDQSRAGRARARRDGAGTLLANSVCRAASQIATAAGCLSFLSTEIA
jgi:hypothetical protein